MVESFPSMSCSPSSDQRGEEAKNAAISSSWAINAGSHAILVPAMGPSRATVPFERSAAANIVLQPAFTDTPLSMNDTVIVPPRASCCCAPSTVFSVVA